MSTADKLAAALEGLTERQALCVDIATALCNRMRDVVIAQVKRFPEDWDGHEVRELLARLFERERTSAMHGTPRKRKFMREVRDLDIQT